ncbi:hypothetical protein [Sphingomonas sp.]|uniref:hypothetical protein n=1 Tax=Sphingomonas sp. TaxID=28214 RepID=UPI003D6D0894
MNLDARTIRILATLNNDAENAASLALDEPRRNDAGGDEEGCGNSDMDRGLPTFEFTAKR